MVQKSSRSGRSSETVGNAMHAVWKCIFNNRPALVAALFLFLLLWMPALPASAAPQAAQTAALQAGKPVPEKNEKALDHVTPLSVQHEGTDSIGSRLAMRLKERFNQSNLFILNNDEEKDEPKIVLMITTLSEFSTRPGIGSVYSVCWVFKQGKGYLPFLLKHSTGVVSAEDLDALVESLLERTDGIASRYTNLWK